MDHAALAASVDPAVASLLLRLGALAVVCQILVPGIGLGWVLGLPVLAFSAVVHGMGEPPRTGVEALAGKRGRAKTRFERRDGAFVGSVFADGARFSALATMPVEQGAPIVVDAVLTHPTRLMVRPA